MDHTTRKPAYISATMISVIIPPYRRFMTHQEVLIMCSLSPVSHFATLTLAAKLNGSNLNFYILKMEKRICALESMHWEISRFLWDEPTEEYAWKTLHPLSKELKNIREEYKVSEVTVCTGMIIVTYDSCFNFKLSENATHWPNGQAGG